jgi:hypothetical protein
LAAILAGCFADDVGGEVFVKKFDNEFLYHREKISSKVINAFHALPWYRQILIRIIGRSHIFKKIGSIRTLSIPPQDSPRK